MKLNSNNLNNIFYNSKQATVTFFPKFVYVFTSTTFSVIKPIMNKINVKIQ